MSSTIKKTEILLSFYSSSISEKGRYIFTVISIFHSKYFPPETLNPHVITRHKHFTHIYCTYTLTLKLYHLAQLQSSLDYIDDTIILLVLIKYALIQQVPRVHIYTAVFIKDLLRYHPHSTIYNKNVVVSHLYGSIKYKRFSASFYHGSNTPTSTLDDKLLALLGLTVWSHR